MRKYNQFFSNIMHRNSIELCDCTRVLSKYKKWTLKFYKMNF